MNTSLKEQLLETRTLDEFNKVLKASYPDKSLTISFLGDKLDKEVFDHLSKLMWGNRKESVYDHTDLHKK